MDKFKNFGENKVTFALIVINIIVFVLMTMAGGSENLSVLVRFGAVTKPHIVSGQWWRIITACFLHIGFPHLLFNMYFLYRLGPVFERLYGSISFLIIYLLAGIMGNLLSFAFGNMNTVSAGASTSLYGMFGLAIGIMLNYRDDAMLRNFGASFISIIVINIIYSLILPGISIFGHLGGLIGGLLLAGVFPVIHRQLATGTRIVSVSAFVILAFLFVRIGLNSISV